MAFLVFIGAVVALSEQATPARAALAGASALAVGIGLRRMRRL